MFFHISKRHLDMYGRTRYIPVTNKSCDFTNAENGDYCDGWIFERQTRVLQVRASRVIDALPQVRRQTVTGAGSFVEIPIPDGDKQPDLRNPVQMLTVDRTSFGL